MALTEVSGDNHYPSCSLGFTTSKSARIRLITTIDSVVNERCEIIWSITKWAPSRNTTALETPSTCLYDPCSHQTLHFVRTRCLFSVRALFACLLATFPIGHCSLFTLHYYHRHVPRSELVTCYRLAAKQNIHLLLSCNGFQRVFRELRCFLQSFSFNFAFPTPPSCAFAFS